MSKRKRAASTDKDLSNNPLLDVAEKFDVFLQSLDALLEATPVNNYSTRGLSSNIEDRVVIAKVLKRMRLKGQLSWMDQYLKDEVDQPHPAEIVSSTVSSMSLAASHGDATPEDDEKLNSFGKEHQVQQLAELPSQAPDWPPLLPEIRNKALLKQAFTHRSYATACAPAQASKVFLTSLHNERLEFLGDSFLNHSVTKMLFVRMPDAREGEMSLLRADLIGNTTAAAFGRLYGFDKQLLLNDTAERDGVRKTPKVIADTFEAYLGAIILDGRDGVIRADNWLKALMNPRITEYFEKKIDEPVDTFAKQRVWNHYTRLYPATLAPDGAIKVPLLIKYEWVDGGGGNEGGFIVAAKLYASDRGIDGQELGRGFGLNKKEAEHRAAMAAAKLLKL